MQKAVIYTRVSTDEQANNTSLEDQEARLRKYCSQQGYEVIKHYQDDHSAKNFKRPAFTQFLEDLKAKRIKPNLFVCVRIDRFSRHTLSTLVMVDEFDKWGIKPIFLENPVDFSVPESKMAFVLGA